MLAALTEELQRLVAAQLSGGIPIVYLAGYEVNPGDPVDLDLTQLQPGQEIIRITIEGEHHAISN